MTLALKMSSVSSSEKRTLEIYQISDKQCCVVKACKFCDLEIVHILGNRNVFWLQSKEAMFGSHQTDHTSFNLCKNIFQEYCTKSSANPEEAWITSYKSI